MDVAWIEIALREIIALLVEIRDLLKKEDNDKMIELLEQIVELLQANNALLTEVNDTCQEILAKIKKKEK